MIRRIILVVFLSISSCTTMFSQRWLLTRYEAIGGLGTTNIFGTVGGSASQNNLFGLKDISFNSTGLSLMLAGRYFLEEIQAVKANIILGYTYGSDAGSINAFRGYKYKTFLTEVSGQYEYYFVHEGRKDMMSNIYNRRGMINNFWQYNLYGFVGLGGLFFDPTLTVNQKYYQTSGYKTDMISGYSKISGEVMLGLGISYSLDRFTSIGFEIGRRFTLTDYMDGLSTTYAKHNDTYYFSVFNYIYKLETNRRGVPLIFTRSLY